MFAYLPIGTICFRNVSFSTSLQLSQKKFISVAYFLNQVNAKLLP